MTREELGRLLSLISHEVRAPLGVMRGYLRLLEQGTDLSAQQRQAIAASLRAGDRATEILQQLSTLARMHRGETSLARRAVHLPGLLRAAADAAVMPTEPSITVHVQDPPDVTVSVDEDLLRIAIASLTTAVARAQAADTRVRLAAEAEGDDTRGVAITVLADTPATEPHQEQEIDVLRGGLGLDLPIATYIIGAHHGALRERRVRSRLIGFSLALPSSASPERD